MPGFNVFQRAFHSLPLSPTERAFLKFVYAAIWSAVVTGGTAIVQYLMLPGHAVNPHIVLSVFFGAFFVTLGETFRKYVTAHFDGPLGSALVAVSTALKAQQQTTDAASTVQNLTTTSTSR